MDDLDRFNEYKQRLLDGSYESLDDQEKDDLLYDVLNYFYTIEDLNQILEFANKLYLHRCSYLGKEDVDTIEMLNDIGLAYYELEDYDNALNTLNDCLQQEIKADLHEENILNTQSNLATVYFKIDNYEKAIEYGNLAYQGRVDLLGKSNHSTLVSQANLGVYYAANGDINEALNICKEAYEIRLEAFGKEDIGTIDCLENLAERYNELGDNYHALEIYEQVYKQRLEKQSINNKDTINVLNKLSTQYLITGSLTKAVESIEYCYEEAIKYFSNKTLLINDIKNNMSIIYSETGRMEEAIEIVEEVYKVRKELLGPTHTDTLDCLNNLSIYLSHIGRFNEAYEKAREFYLANVQKYGESNYNSFDGLINYANCLSQLGHIQEEIKFLEKYKDIAIEEFGYNHAITIEIITQLTLAYSDNKQYELSMDLSRECYSKMKEMNGLYNQDTARRLSNFSSCYVDLQQYPQALSLAQKAYAIQYKILGIYHYETLLTLTNMASIMCETNQLISAYYISLFIYDLIKDDPYNHFENIIYSLTLLAFTYQKLEMYSNEIITLNAYFKVIEDNMKYNELFNLSYLKNELENVMVNYHDYCELIFKYDLLNEENYLQMVKFKNFYYDIELNSNLEIRKELNNIEESIANYDLSDDEYKEYANRRNELMKEMNNQSILDEVYSFDLSRLHNKKSIIDIYRIDDSLYGVVVIDSNQHIRSILLSKEEVKSNKLKEFVKEEYVYMIVDGQLFDYSFERLFTQVIYLSSIKVLMKEQPVLSDHIPDIFVNADYFARDRVNSREKYGNLPGSEIENYYLNDLLDHKNIYNEQLFNKQNLLHVNQPRFLHISTHGDYKDYPSIQLLDRPRIILSGFNTTILNRNKKYVTAKEIYDEVDLKGTEFVFLDACYTGVGESIPSEGLYGFRRVFEVKGCHYIISTLSSVNDNIAALFSIVFYTLYDNGKGVEDAFFTTKRILSDFSIMNQLWDNYVQYFDCINNKEYNNINELNTRIEKIINSSNPSNNVPMEELFKFVLQKC